ncbi:50S ribosomal protein L15 [bacterium]|jgi:large subunit ribosomal protein L15|nr:50S ribosomal protein L15 [bacterium]NBX49375.1 50S ribosomal protein L15 [bacterium]
MTLSLHDLRPGFGAKKDKKRVGRGLGSKGTTAGRGQKGQSSRAGASGLQRIGSRHLMLATPKLRGFKALSSGAQAVNLADIAGAFVAGEVVTPRTLSKKGLVRDAKQDVKILGVGELSHAVTVKGCRVSATAQAAIEKAGGKIEA